MSQAACKEVLCLESAAAIAKRAAQQINRAKYSKEDAAALRTCAENFIKDVMAIAEG
jgi:hypothetical protein